MVMNNVKRMLVMLLSLLGLSQTVSGQSVTKYFVKFKDKNQSPYQLSNPSQFLGSAGVYRRSYYSLNYDSTDLPVNPAYLNQLDAVANVTLLYATKWLNGAVVSIPSSASTSALVNISLLPFVATTSQINPRLRRLSPMEKLQPAGNDIQNLRPSSPGSYNMGGSTAQNQQIQVDCLHNLGFRGQGMVIAVMDVGFNNVDNNPVFDSLRTRGGILGTRDFVAGGTSVYEDASHGAHVLSCMAAVQPGTIIGTAPMANYWLLRTEDVGSETIVEEYNWVRAAEFADSVGADILTTSLGYTTFDNSAQNHTYATLNGKTAPMSIAATMAARKGMFVLNAAGNEGGGAWNYISVPADADSICTVGAVDNTGVVGSFSGVGPTADGRIKPDLLARGVNAWVADVNGMCFGANGTSFACPVMAGGVACAWQRSRSARNIQLLQALKASANNAGSPNNSKGWGIPNICSVYIGFQENLSNDAFSVFPNPFSSSLNVRYQSNGHTLLGVQVIDMLGRIVSDQEVAPGVLEFDLRTAHLANGVYTLRLNTDNGPLLRKIVKQ